MKTIRLNFIFLLLAAAVLAGCSASAFYYNDGYSNLAPTNKKDVKIFADRHIEKAFDEIGYVTINAPNGGSGDEFKALVKEAAAAKGADAVINFRIFGYTAGGIAIKYK